MKAILFAALFFMGGTSFAGVARVVAADSLSSSNNATTQTVPAATGTLMTSVGLVQEIPSGTVNSSNTSFTLANTPGVSASVIVYLDGIPLIQGSGKDYTISGATITMTTAPATGQTMYASYSKF